MSYYTYDVLLKYDTSRMYGLYTLKGIRLFDVPAANDEDAMVRAKAIMSSFNGVRIRWEYEYESDSKSN